MLTGGAAWVLAPRVQPELVCAAVAIPVVAALAVVGLIGGLDRLVTSDERRVLGVLLAVVLIATGKATLAAGPVGELYAGTISRTLEVGDRSDSRIPYHVVQLVAHGTRPYSAVGRANFLPYAFSDRGPMAGLAASPIVLLSGARVPVAVPNEPWAPFDAQGFMAYRLAMFTLALTVLLALFGLLTVAAGPAAGLFAVVVAALTPFVIHDTYFTWPKLLAASFVLLAAELILRHRPGWAGLLAGAGYLAHPLALLSLPTLGLLLLIVIGRDRPHRLGTSIRGLAWLGAGTGAWLIFWRVVNLRHYAQGNFLLFFIYARSGPTASFSVWFGSRVESLLNTLVPLRLFFFQSSDPAINAYGGSSPPIVHFFFQYWTALPFAVGILFFPLLVAGVIRLSLRAPWLVVATVIAPFLLFAIYWGGPTTGLLREGLHVWVLTLVAVYAWWRFSDPRRAWQGSVLERLALSGRAIEVLLMLVLPTWLTARSLISRAYVLTDVVALLLMVGGLAWLAWWTWTSSSMGEVRREHPN